MAALTVVITGDATKLQAEMTKIEQMAKRTGQNIKTHLDTGSGGGESSHLKSGVIREMLVLVRELGRGNLKQAAGSASLLIQRMGLLKFLLNPISLAIAAIAAGFYGAYKWTSYLTDKLTGLKLPDFHPEYLAKHLQRLGMIEQAQKDINREVERSIELWDSATKASERTQDSLKSHFDHIRKMVEYEEEAELAKAKTEKQKEAIRAKYANANLQINQGEREAELAEKNRLRNALEVEAKAKKAQADKIAMEVSSKEHDDDHSKKLKADADAAQKYLDERKAEEEKKKLAPRDGLEERMATMGIVADHPLQEAEKKREAEARDAIKRFQGWTDTAFEREERRKRMEQLNKDAAEAASRAAVLNKEIAAERAKNVQKAKDEAEEAAAKQKAENAESMRWKSVHGHLNQFQQVGAYAGGGQLIQLTKSINHHLASIDKKLGHGRGVTGSMGKVFYGR